MADRHGPLSDIRIIAVEQYGAGPFGSLQLADLGAEVIKVEDPRTGGDIGRYVPPYQDGEDSLFFEFFNRGKSSLSLDLATPAGRTVFEDLVRVSDAVYSNLRGDVPGHLRITYGDLAPVNPRIVCCSLSGFGTTGPRRAEGGYDYVLQALAGWMTLTGEPDAPPAKTGPSLVDYSGGLFAALALLAGVHQARRDGHGTDCDISLFETALTMLGYLGTWHLTEGYQPARTAQSAHPSMVPFQSFRTADSWIVIACPKEKFFRRFADALDRPDLGSDPRFADFAARGRHRAELLAEVEPILAARSTAEWDRVLRAAGVPCGPVQTVADALREPQIAARNGIVETEHPRWGTVRQVASPLRLGSQPVTAHRAPHRNEQATDILSGLLGYSADTVERLDTAGAFGTSGGDFRSKSR